MKLISKIVVVTGISAMLAACGENSPGASTSAVAPTATSPVTAPAPAAPAAPAEQVAEAPVDANALFLQAKDLRDATNGVTQDLPKAFDLFKKASEAGNRDAMFFLAVMYENAEAVEQDYEKALDWYTKSDALGCGSAAEGIKRVKEKMSTK